MTFSSMYEYLWPPIIDSINLQLIFQLALFYQLVLMCFQKNILLNPCPMAKVINCIPLCLEKISSYFYIGTVTESKL